jgi:hypothetical protein
MAAKNRHNPAFGNPVVNDSPDAYADENVRKDLLEGFRYLILGINQPFLLRQCWGGNVHGRCPADKFLHLIFHVQLFNQRTASHSNHKPQHHIENRNLCPENTHQKNKTSQVHHRR